MPKKKKPIEEVKIKITPTTTADDLMRSFTFTKDGFLCLVCVPAFTRCKYDLLAKINEIVKDGGQANQILEIFEKEFPSVLSEVRIIAEMDYLEKAITEQQNPKA